MHQVPLDLLGECLSYLCPSSLLVLETVSRFTKAVAAKMEVWKSLFEAGAVNYGWHMPCVEPSCGWKQLYFTYLRETNVTCNDHRNQISGRFIWRCTDVWNKLRDPRTRNSSSPFFLGCDEDGVPLQWGITVQRKEQNGLDVLGVFLTQYHATNKVRCLFSLGIVDDGVLSDTGCATEVTQPRSVLEHYHITTIGGEKRPTCGFLFGMNQVTPSLLERPEVLISVDLTILGGGPSNIGLLYNILDHRPLPVKVRTGVIKELKRFARQSAALSGAYYLQTYASGPAPIISALEDTSLESDVHMAAASAMWSILDTSEIRMNVNLLGRTIKVACQSVQHALLEDVRSQAQGSETSEYDLQRKEDTLYTLLGILVNIPVSEELCHLMFSCRNDMPLLLFDILSKPHFGRVHVLCLHLLTSFLLHNSLPLHFTRKLRSALNKHITRVAQTPRFATVGMILSLRDIADFALPLLFSPHLECIAFGAFCINIMYL